MTQNAWPFTGQTITMAQFRAWSRVTQGSRVWSGLSVTADTSGRNLIVTAGTATVDGCMFTSDSTMTLAVPANTTGTTRRAYALLTLDDSATPKIQLGVKLGPAGGGDASFTQTESGVYELPLAYADLASGAASFANSSTTQIAPVMLDPTVVTATANSTGAQVSRGSSSGVVSVSARAGITGRVIIMGQTSLYCASPNDAGYLRIGGSSIRWHTHNHGPMLLQSNILSVLTGQPGQSLTGILTLSVDPNSGSSTIDVWDTQITAIGV